MIKVLWLCGADAAGKSTVGWEIYSRLTSSGGTAAYLEIGYLGFCSPQPGGDPTWLVERNLAAMWVTFAEAGARYLVAAGVVVTRQQWQRYIAALPNAQAVLCRLRVAAQIQSQRITRRGVLSDDFAGFAVDTDGIPIRTVADRVLCWHRLEGLESASPLTDVCRRTGRWLGRWSGCPAWQ